MTALHCPHCGLPFVLAAVADYTATEAAERRDEWSDVVAAAQRREADPTASFGQHDEAP